MWSLGVVMYIVLAGAHPFDLQNDASDEEVVRRILEEEASMEGPVWDQVSPEGKGLLLSLLHRDPTKRPTATEVLQHPWMRGAASDRVLDSTSENLRMFHRGRRRLKVIGNPTRTG